MKERSTLKCLKSSLSLSLITGMLVFLINLTSLISSSCWIGHKLQIADKIRTCSLSQWMTDWLWWLYQYLIKIRPCLWLEIHRVQFWKRKGCLYVFLHKVSSCFLGTSWFLERLALILCIISVAINKMKISQWLIFLLYQ